MTDKPSLATGAEMTPATFADFVERLRYHCRGKGVDDHCTADAIFLVERRDLIYGIDKDFTDNRVLTCDDSEWFTPQDYWDDCDEEQRAALNFAAQEYADLDFLSLADHAKWHVLGSLDDHNVYGWGERWTFVNMHFTKEAAEAFIKRKKHDYPKGLRVYVDAQSYCWEFNAIKEALMSGLPVLKDESAEKPSHSEGININQPPAGFKLPAVPPSAPPPPPKR